MSHGQDKLALTLKTVRSTDYSSIHLYSSEQVIFFSLELSKDFSPEMGTESSTNMKSSAL